MKTRYRTCSHTLFDKIKFFFLIYICVYWVRRKIYTYFRKRKICIILFILNLFRYYVINKVTFVLSEVLNVVIISFLRLMCAVNYCLGNFGRSVHWDFQFLVWVPPMRSVFCNTQHPLGAPSGKSLQVLNRENVRRTRLHLFILASLLANSHLDKLARLGGCVKMSWIMLSQFNKTSTAYIHLPG